MASIRLKTAQDVHLRILLDGMRYELLFTIHRPENFWDEHDPVGVIINSFSYNFIYLDYILGYSLNLSILFIKNETFLATFLT